MLKLKFIFALLIFIVAILINQTTINIRLNEVSKNARIINIAGKQRMFSKQITKIAYTSNLNKTSFYNKDLKTLEKVVDTFSRTHNYLKKINAENHKNSQIDSLFKKNNLSFSNIVRFSKAVIKNPNDLVTLNAFIKNIKENEHSFLFTMNAIVLEYQQISEDKILFIKSTQLFSNVIKLIIIISLFLFLLMPLSKQNKKLILLNTTLKRFKNKIKQKEKEKKNVEQILDKTNEVARIGTWEVDLISQKVTWSRITKEIHEVLKSFKPEMKTAINFYKEGESREKILRLVEDVIKNGTTYDCELQITTAKGNTLWIRTIGQSTFSKGKCVRISGVFQDINEMKLSQQKLMSQNKQLENFAHITSHNLRAPISNLNSLLTLYHLSENRKEKNIIFNKFEIVISHLSTTLNTLVEVISIKGTKKVAFEDIYFQTILTKIEELFSGDIITKKALIVSDFSQANKIYYNKVYLESILTNLISNSLRYSSLNRDLTIKITTKIHKNRIQLWVTDNGLGIDLKKHEHKIFGLNKVFHRHPDSKGVGLYLLKNQIESLHGSISAKSEVEKGTTIIVEF